MENRDDKLQITNLFKQMEWRQDKTKNKMFKVDLFNDYGVHLKLHSPEEGKTSFKKKADVTVPIRFEELCQLEAMVKHIAVEGIKHLHEDGWMEKVEEEFTKSKKKVELIAGNKDGKMYLILTLEMEGAKSMIYFPTHRLFAKNEKSFGNVGTKRLLELSDVLHSVMNHSSQRLANHFKRYFDQNTTPEDAGKKYADGEGSQGTFNDDDEYPF